VAAHGAGQPHRFVEHKVRFGERLRDIAADYGASRPELRRLNVLADEEPPPGRVLVIPDRGRRPSDHTNELLVALDPGVRIDPAGREEVFFPVRYRQPLAGVARFFGVSAADVGMWNGIDPEADLQRGMVVRLFVAPDFDQSTAVLVPRSAVKFLRAGDPGTARALRVASLERQPNVTRVSYTIRRGDSLGAIAARFGTTVDEVRAENGLGDDAMLSPGDQLDVPARRAPPRRVSARRAHPERVASR
jgi:LysM repeat protein